MSKFNKSIVSWCLYDWANSAFALTVMAGFFPGFFKAYWCAGAETAVSTARLGMGNAIAGLSIALLSPVLGAIAGAGASKKKYLSFFIILGVVMSMGLAAIGKGQWPLALIIYVFASMGFSLANLFYDSLLVDVVDRNNVDVVSSWGYALGYIGCALLFAINAVMYQKPHLFGLENGAQAIRVSFLTVGAWWLLFSLPIMLFVKQKDRAPNQKIGMMISNGMIRLRATARDIIKHKPLFLFLLAYWLYFDGVFTVIEMATDFGLSIGIPLTRLLIALLVVQLVAFPCSILFGYIARVAGAKNTILASIAIYIAVCGTGAWIIHTEGQFMLFAGMTGIAQGAVQALSRSFFLRLVPAERSTEFFGFYHLVGKFAVIIGPALLAIVNILVHTLGFESQIASRSGMTALCILFISGAILLLFVKENPQKA